MAAVAAGDKDERLSFSKQADKLLGNPESRLLSAQTAALNEICYQDISIL